MGLLRLYRKFYCVSPETSGDTYTLITPTSLSAEAYVAGSGDTISTSLVETGIPLVAESQGVYYADLNSTLYSSDVTYDLVFTVQYTAEAPAGRRLTTRFRIKPFNIAGQLDYEINDVTPFDYEISDNTQIEYEIIGTYN